VDFACSSRCWRAAAQSEQVSRRAARQQQPEQAKSTYLDTRNNENGEYYEKMTKTKSCFFQQALSGCEKINVCVSYPF